MKVYEIFDFFKGKEETLADDPEYKGWLKVYLKNPDIAELHKRHKEFLQYFQKEQANEGIFDFKKTFGFGGDEMHQEYVPFVLKNIRRYGDRKTKILLKKEFPNIKPIDVNRAMKFAMDEINSRSAVGSKR